MAKEKLANEPNWKECAIALNRKLNLIGARLKLIEKQSLTYDVSQTARELVEEFHLDTEQKFIHPTYDQLRLLDNEIGSLLHRYVFASAEARDSIMKLLHEKHSDFSIQLALYGAFV